MILGINAGRARSGGAVSHLIGILGEATPVEHGISSVHVWSYDTLLAALPDRPWLTKHAPPELNASLLKQLWWERRSLPVELVETQCSALLNVDAGSVCRFQPSVTMSRDMLSYEPGESQRYGVSTARLRLIALRYVQNSALKATNGAVFLTDHAAEVIQRSTGLLSNVARIPHGVAREFRNIRKKDWGLSCQRPIRCLYVSNCAPYKHQWNVVQAVAKLRQYGRQIELNLVGGGEGPSQRKLQAQIQASDPQRQFVRQQEFLKKSELPRLFAEADVFVFASSCENMPNTLLEAMAAALPIACSNRGPMPEILQDGGIYFDPEDPETIGTAIDQLLADPAKRAQVALRAEQLSQQYSWERCARETLTFVVDTTHRTMRYRGRHR